MAFDHESTYLVVIGIIASLFVLSRMLSKGSPKESSFFCARCNTLSQHTPRTIEAWRNNKTTFFCQACHEKWLQSRSKQKIGLEPQRAKHGKSGCLGVILLFIALPGAAYVIGRLYA